MPHITQLSANEIISGEKFNSYIFPKLPISQESTKVTGIYVNESGEFKVNGEEKKAVGIHGGLQDFFSWLAQFHHAILVAQNGRRFDFPVLVNAARNCFLLETLLSSVQGCIDSLAVFRKVFPGQPNYKQEHLVNSLLHTTYKAHDAMEDVISLSLLFTKTMLSDNDLLAYSFAIDAVYNNLLFSQAKSKNITSLEILMAKGVVKRATSENMAGSGLNLMHLHKIFQPNGEDGLRAIFTQKGQDGSPRVTNVKKKVVDDVIPKLALYFEYELSV